MAVATARRTIGAVPDAFDEPDEPLPYEPDWVALLRAEAAVTGRDGGRGYTPCRADRVDVVEHLLARGYTGTMISKRLRMSGGRVSQIETAWRAKGGRETARTSR